MAGLVAPPARSSLALCSRLLSSSSAFRTNINAPRAHHISLTPSSSPFSRLVKPASVRLFSQSRTMPYDATTFLQATELRRSIYALNKTSPVSDARIQEIVQSAIKNTPSSFNSQSTRLVVLLKEEHNKFWDIVTEILKAHVPEDKWEHTGSRLTGFRNGYGTILFYEDPEPVKALQSKFAQYADKFPTWSEHTSAMHQYVLWTALETEGFGANLQHYNPLPDQKASATWNIPLEWSLKAQLVFGGIEPGTRENLSKRDEQPVDKRVFFHGA